MTATKQKERTMNIALNFKDGSKVELTGSDAHRALQAFRRIKVLDGNEVGLTFTNPDGNEEFVFFHMLKGYTLLPTAEKEIDGRECDPMDCPTVAIPKP